MLRYFIMNFESTYLKKRLLQVQWSYFTLGEIFVADLQLPLQAAIWLHSNAGCPPEISDMAGKPPFSMGKSSKYSMVNGGFSSTPCLARG